MDSLMKHLRLLILTLPILVVLFAFLQAEEASKADTGDETNEIQWYRYQEGWEKATVENKHMFVNFTAVWCRWCKELDKKVFSQPEIIDKLNNEFVSVKVWQEDKDTFEIDGYRIASKDLIKSEFRVNSYPQLWWVSPEGVRVGPWKGFLPDTLLLKFLEDVKYYRYDSTRDEDGEEIQG